MIKELIDEVDRAMESLQAIRIRLRLMQLDERQASTVMVNHAHGESPFHDHPDTQAYGVEHFHAHNISS